MPDGSSQSGTLVLTHDDGEGQTGEAGYIVVAQEDAKGGFALHHEHATEHKAQKPHEKEDEAETTS